MNEREWFIVWIAAVVVLAGWVTFKLGGAVTAIGIREDCDRLGQFRRGELVYQCEPKERP